LSVFGKLSPTFPSPKYTTGYRIMQQPVELMVSLLVQCGRHGLGNEKERDSLHDLDLPHSYSSFSPWPRLTADFATPISKTSPPQNATRRCCHADINAENTFSLINRATVRLDHPHRWFSGKISRCHLFQVNSASPGFDSRPMQLSFLRFGGPGAVVVVWIWWCW
jgi:hypothetical protein